MSTVIVPAPEVTVTLDGDAFEVSDPSLTLDSARVPYASARVTLPVLSDDLVESLDPRDGIRVPLSFGGRACDLGLRRRVVDHKAKTVTLELAGDEALLADYAPLEDDEAAFGVQSSLRAVCNYVLGKIGASLSAGDDVDVTTAADAINLIDPASLGATGTRCTLDLSDPSWGVPAPSLNLYNPTGSDSYASIGGDFGAMRLGMRPGATYVLSATGRVKVAVGGTADFHARRIAVVYRAGQGHTWVASPAIPTTVGTATRVSVKVSIPADATEAFVRLYLGHSTGQVQWDAIRLSEYTGDPTDIDYFDGSTPTSARYSYAWSTTSPRTSRRTALIDRPPSSLLWQAGVSAWDFLEPLAAAAEMTLWCDETRTWRLQTIASATVPGVVSVSPGITRDGTDTVDLADEINTPSGVAVIYEWTDDAGTHRQIDTAGDPGKVRTVNLRRPYPGPGVAAAILARAQGTGRTQEVTTIARYDATPGMTAILSLPGAPDTTGRVAALTFHPDGFMDITTSGLVDIIPGSIAALTGTIDSLTGTIDSL